MKSHTESKDLLLFDFKAFFLNKDKTPELIKRALNASNNWDTCPCGQLPEILPRDFFNSSPEDDLLRYLGSAFHQALEDECYEIAEGLYDMINGRGHDIIQDEVESKKTALKNLLKEQQDALNITKKKLKELGSF